MTQVKHSFKLGDRVKFVGRPGRYVNPPSPNKVYTVRDTPGVLSGVFLQEHNPSSWYFFEDFELVEPDQREVPGVPEGYRLVRLGAPKKGELYVDYGGDVVKAPFDYVGKNHPVLVKITRTERLWVRVNNSTGETIQSWYLDGQNPPDRDNITVVQTNKTREVPA